MFGVVSYVNCLLWSIVTMFPEHRTGRRRVEKECEGEMEKTQQHRWLI